MLIDRSGRTVQEVAGVLVAHVRRIGLLPLQVAALDVGHELGTCDGHFPLAEAVRPYPRHLRQQRLRW